MDGDRTPSASAPPPGARPLYGADRAPAAPRQGGGSPRRSWPLAVLVVAAVALGGLLGLSLLGGSSDGTALSPIAQAAEKTGSLTGARFSGTGSVSAQGVDMTMTFSGTYDAGDDRETMRMELQAPAVPQAAAAMNPFLTVRDGSTFYMSAPAFASELPEGKAWMKMDMAELGAMPEGDSGQLNGLEARAILDQLSVVGDDAREVGRERVRGAKTTHYVATVDPALHAEQLREEGNDLMADAVEAQGGPSTVEVWVDRKGLVRRTALSVPFEAVGGPGATMSMTIELYDFGIDPQIDIPSDSESFDATEFGRIALEDMAGES